MRYFLLVLCMILALPMSISASSSNTPYNWGFAKNKDHVKPEVGKQYEEMLKRQKSVYVGKDKNVYLTFDNGYENGYTSGVLDVLKKQNVTATFFVTGQFLESEPSLVKRMAKEGHIVGNHSWHHPDFTQVSDERLKKELKCVKDEYTKLTGKKEMRYLRPPRGVFSERVLEVARNEGYTTVFWSVAFVDWKTDQQKGWRYAYDNIMEQIHPGAVILLHTVSKDNAEALERAIIDLKKQGYKFKSLDHLVNEKQKEKSAD
ncbi:delta-lactam-biosynthetic de-N-acetylase [Bacillus sp. JZ8]